MSDFAENFTYHASAIVNDCHPWPYFVGLEGKAFRKIPGSVD